MAMLALRPLVVDFVDTTMFSQGREFVLENIVVGSGSPMVGVTVKEGLECCGDSYFSGEEKRWPASH